MPTAPAVILRLGSTRGLHARSLHQQACRVYLSRSPQTVKRTPEIRTSRVPANGPELRTALRTTSHAALALSVHRVDPLIRSSVVGGSVICAGRIPSLTPGSRSQWHWPLDGSCPRTAARPDAAFSGFRTTSWAHSMRFQVSSFKPGRTAVAAAGVVDGHCGVCSQCGNMVGRAARCVPAVPARRARRARAWSTPYSTR